MRILTLTLKNCRSHQATVLDRDQFKFLRGPNGTGKSSIQMALEYLFYAFIFGKHINRLQIGRSRDFGTLNFWRFELRSVILTAIVGAGQGVFRCKEIPASALTAGTVSTGLLRKPLSLIARSR